MAVEAVPKNYPRVSPVFALKDSAKAITFYEKVFGAKLRLKMEGPGGAIAHCEVEFGDSLIMFGEPWDEASANTAKGKLSIYVPDCDATFKKALEHGAKSVAAPENQFYGDRIGKVMDPFGVEWTIGSHVEDVSEEEMKRRMAKLYGG